VLSASVAKVFYMDRFDTFRSHGVISWADERLLVSQKVCAARNFFMSVVCVCMYVWVLVVDRLAVSMVRLRPST
jgi:hypothetical protein